MPYPPEKNSRALAHDLVMAALAQCATAPGPLPPRPPGRPRIWTQASCLMAIQAYVAREGRVPTDTEFRASAQHGLPARATLLRYWRGGVSLAVCAAGFLPAPTRRKPPPRRSRGWAFAKTTSAKETTGEV